MSMLDTIKVFAYIVILMVFFGWGWLNMWYLEEQEVEVSNALYNRWIISIVVYLSLLFIFIYVNIYTRSIASVCLMYLVVASLIKNVTLIKA